jgi:hypothetical protein
MPLVYDKHPRKIEEDAIRSLAGLETSPAAGSSRDRPGSTPRRREDLVWVDWRWGSGRRWRQCAPTTGWPPAGRRNSNFSSVQHNAGQRVEGEASLGRVGGVEVEGRRRFRSGARYRGGGPALPRSRTSARERNRGERGEKGWLGTRLQGL